MKTTGNLGLKKPDGTDIVNIDDLNSNMDILDTEVVKKASASTDGRMSKEDKGKLDGIESGAEVNNISDGNVKDLTDGGDSSLHHHTSDRSRANHIGKQSSSTISNFAETVRATALTGLSTATNSAIAATDNILKALGKLQAQINSKANSSHNHDSRYYTESEINSKMVAKLNASQYTAVDIRNKLKTVDGAGSGLDADTVDGKQAEDLAKTMHSNGTVMNNNTTLESGFYTISDGATVGLSSKWYHIINMKHFDENGYNAQMAVDLSGKADLYIRFSGGGTWSAWNKIWHAGNDGSGSGLDADRLDGIHASSFVLHRGRFKGDLNSAYEFGLYDCDYNCTNKPENTWGALYVSYISFNLWIQQLWVGQNGTIYIRHSFDKDGSRNWNPWKMVYHSGNVGSDQLRKTTISTANPSGGSDGDIWIKY